MHARVVIAYRDEGNGNGSFYDHYTMQRATGMATAISVPEGMTATDLYSYSRTTTHVFKYGTPNPAVLGKLIPEETKALEDENNGLLYIPGRARETETKRKGVHSARTKHQEELIRKARLEGRPILGICAGSWDIWSAYGGEFIDVAHHCYRGGMPRILTGARIGNNVLVHRVKVEKSTFLAAAMGNSAATTLQDLSVNSVHWQAPNPEKVPYRLIVSARSVRDNGLAPENAQDADENTVEAFESEFGAPVVGVQWHPEAYNSGEVDATKHLGILKTMAEAGRTFVRKKAVLRELSSAPFFRTLAEASENKVGVDELADDVAKIDISKPS